MITPRIDGTFRIHSSTAQFLHAFQERVAAGLLAGRPHRRSNYEIADVGPDRLRMYAADWRTAVNVGLNELDLRFPTPSSVYYEVGFWRWAAYALILSGTLGAIGVLLLLTTDVRGYVTRHSASRLPGFSIEQNVTIAWAMVLFWGFVWPWLLIALHKRPLRRLVERLLTDIDVVAASG